MDYILKVILISNKNFKKYNVANVIKKYILLIN